VFWGGGELCLVAWGGLGRGRGVINDESGRGGGVWRGAGCPVHPPHGRSTLCPQATQTASGVRPCSSRCNRSHSPVASRRLSPLTGYDEVHASSHFGDLQEP